MSPVDQGIEVDKSGAYVAQSTYPVHLSRRDPPIAAWTTPHFYGCSQANVCARAEFRRRPEASSSNIDGQKADTIGFRTWQPIWYREKGGDFRTSRDDGLKQPAVCRRIGTGTVRPSCRVLEESRSPPEISVGSSHRGRPPRVGHDVWSVRVTVATSRRVVSVRGATLISGGRPTPPTPRP